MTETHSLVQRVQTATVTPAMREARRALRYAGASSLVIAMWLGVGLSFCSVNPELSTQTDHLLGSVTHIVCSWLLNSLGLMSFSVVLLIARFGRLLWSAHLPKVSKSDLFVYLLFLLFSATQLQLALNTTVFGAPIGGAVGAWVSGQMIPLGDLPAQGLMCLSLFGLFFLHSTSAQSSRDVQREVESRALQESAHLNASPVKSMTPHQQAEHSHIFEQVGLQAPEFKEDAQRFEAVDSFYDDLALNSAPSAPEREEELSRDFIFQFDVDSDEPSLTMSPDAIRGQGEPNDSRPDPRLTSLTQQGVQRSSLNLQNHNFTPDSTPVKTSPRKKVSVHPTAPARSPIEQLSQEVSPKIARELILQRGFDAQDVTFALIESNSGPSIDHYRFTSPLPPPKPVYEVTESLNMYIRRTLGRTEPSVLLNHYRERDQHCIEVSWPKRSRALTETQTAIQKLRKLQREESLDLYLGELTAGEQALIPFKELRSMVVTGGRSVSLEAGLDLIMMNIIHQAQPEDLRLIIYDRDGSSHLSTVQLPHLYCPVLSRPDQLIELLEWLPSEYRRRRSLMARLSLQNFEKLQVKRPQEVRIVLIIPQLSQLDVDAQQKLINALEKISHSSYHVGIHLLMNSRHAVGDKLKQLLKSADAHCMLSAESIEEANQLCSPHSEWLLPQQDMLYMRRGHRAERVSTWQLSQRSYHRILSVFSNDSAVQYVNPQCDFKRVIPLSRSPREARGAHANASAAPMSAMGSETGIPSV